MNDWRELIVRRFVRRVARVTAVSDPDGLLRDPGIVQAIQSKGFSILQFEDSVAFRFDYESRFRSKWDVGQDDELVVVFQPGEHEFGTLPADVLDNAQRLSFSIMEIFPKLSYKVVSQLETVHFAALFQAQTRYGSQFHDASQTQGFVLRHVFGIEPTVIKSVPDLLRMLCQRHYTKSTISAQLDEYLIAHLRQSPAFGDWPLEIIVPNRAAFWEFLDERWPKYVHASKGGTMILQEQASELKYSGPGLLPFGHDNVRIYIDNLFEDGLLTPVEWDWNQALDEKWIRVGLLGNKEENTALRFEELRKHLLENCPKSDAEPKQWLTYAYRYAQGSVLWSQMNSSARAQYQEQFPEFRGLLNKHFQDWLTSHYSGLFNYPVSSPLMVHHIPGFIAHQLANGSSSRAAFILVDGLALDQWLILKDVIKSQGLNVPIDESALFAWIPTITPISRQAAFAGKIPRYLSDTFDRTDRDEARWRQFWADRGVIGAEVGFAAIPGNPADLAVIEDEITPQTRALGITLFKVDQIMHGMQLGSMGMSGQVRTWVEHGFVFALLKSLQDKGFNIFISADHGNTEAIGVGRPQEGLLSDKRGERCRIYSDPVLRRTCLAAFPKTLVWDNAGLPDNISTLIAPYGDAFAQSQTQLVCHGGVALEEVCVPFVHIRPSR